MRTMHLSEAIVISSRFQAIFTFALVVVLPRSFVLAGDVEINPGPPGRHQRTVNSSDAPMRHTPSSETVGSSIWLTFITTNYYA